MSRYESPAGGKTRCRGRQAAVRGRREGHAGSGAPGVYAVDEAARALDMQV